MSTLRPLVPALLLLLSCRTSPSPTGMGGTVPASEYCERIAPLFCEFYVRCGRMAVESTEECRPLFLESCNAKYEPRYVMLEGAGLLALSADGIDACRTRLTTVACEAQPSELSGECARMWIGRSGVGAPCGSGVESLVCAPGTECRSSANTCGSCERPSHEEQSAKPPGPSWATVGEQCDSEHRCVYRTSCVNGVCRMSARLHEPCGPQTQCLSGICAPSDGGFSCSRKSRVEEPCKESADCESGSCIDGRCARLPGACFTR